VSADAIFALLHILAAFWYVSGLTAVQVSLIRGWQSVDLKIRVESLEEASHYQGVLMVPGAIAGVATGVFLWAKLDYGLISTGWVLALGALYIATLLVCLPLIGMGLRRARVAGLQARKAGSATADQEMAMRDTVPLGFSGLATRLVPAMAVVAMFGAA